MPGQWPDLQPLRQAAMPCQYSPGLEQLFVGLKGWPQACHVAAPACPLQGGLGEASCLALSSYYRGRPVITAWSSGTGFAGVFGYTWVAVLHVLGEQYL